VILDRHEPRENGRFKAARAVGRAKSTISRDVKSGRISATRNLDGSVSIDPVELHRVYPAIPATVAAWRLILPAPVDTAFQHGLLELCAELCAMCCFTFQ
jgi:hypothetical protein